jgi:chromosome partitioning protein
MAHVIIFGNEKGGSGKTTTAMHLITSLLYLDFKVATLDIDLRQESLTRYIENRKRTIDNKKIELKLPTHFKLNKKYNINQVIEYTNDDIQDFENLINGLDSKFDFIIIDTPGNDNPLNRHAHYIADTIITPINDSFIDVDLLGKVDPNDFSKAIPGIYSSMVWEQKKLRALKKNKEIQWVVVRNRLSSTNVINKRNVASAIKHLGKKLGFYVSPGFGDRVIFKELFLRGLTLLDAKTSSNLIKLNTSVIAARQELREFLYSLKLAEINKKI